MSPLSAAAAKPRASRITSYNVCYTKLLRSCALHVYGGDFFAPPEPRSMWDHETLEEQAWDVERAKALFAGAEARFNAWQDARAGAAN